MIVFHIGASGNPVVGLDLETELYGFEPHLESYKKLLKLDKVLKAQKFYNVAITGTGGPRVFYETRNPRNSSLLVPNIELLKKWDRWERVEIVECWEIQTLSLDEFCETHNVYPDIIKLDTQGTELEILQSFSHLNKVKEVHIEVCYIEIYKDMPLFDETDEFMVSEGFVLKNVRKAYWSKELAFGDAIYIGEKDDSIR